ncbi:hypothetical protein [Halococcus hamelinensis]|uniref:Uncharacterized protein n=1 Tax=Halococcus hamelinensis 100A6 TaxID=1132509 RepID=M0LY00_9EURY|nr:hypothetical protein [Halococcus hamelinensis]EMA38467.1 hypothetical protein C447_09942 [Halococcus hamelinensis 100A6]
MKLQHKPNDSPSTYDGHGVRTTPGETVDTEEIDSDQDADEIGETLLETGYFQRADEGTDANTVDDGAPDEVEPPFDPTGMTVAEIRERLTDEDYTDAQLVAMADVEREDGDDRDGAIDLLSASPEK